MRRLHGRRGSSGGRGALGRAADAGIPGARYLVERLECRQLLSSANPWVVSINRADAAGHRASSTRLDFAVTFSEPVTGVNASDFQVPTQGAVRADGPVTVTPVGGSAYRVAVGGVHGNGAVGLDLVDDGSIRNAAGALLTRAGQPIVFHAAQTYSVGSGTGYVRQVAAADFNSDGKPDLVVRGDSGVGVMLGNGDATLRPVSSFLPIWPDQIDVADVNHDGHPDVVGVISYPGAVCVMLGNGDGTLGMPRTFATVVNPDRFVTADMNGDHRLDVVAWTRYGQPVILPGGGDGTFGDAIGVNNVSVFQSLAPVDVNTDGKMDLVVPPYSSALTVFLGNGNGTFQDAQFANCPTGWEEDVFPADLNHDGLTDLVLSSSVLLGTGGPDFFSAPPQQNLYLSPGAVADVDGDGNLDLILYADTQSTVWIAPGDGHGSFGPAQSFTSRLPGGVAPVAADLNRDGFAELVTPGQAYAGAVAVTVFDRSAGFAGQRYTVAQVFPHVVSIDRADPASVVTGSTSLNYTLTFNKPVIGVGADDLTVITDGTVKAAAVTVTAIDGARYRVDVGGVSGEGSLHLNLEDNGSIVDADGNHLTYGGSGPAFRVGQTFSTGSTFVAADFTGDGRPDLATASAYGISVGAGNGDGTFGNWRSTDYQQLSYFGGDVAAAAGDFNGDGRQDLFVSDGLTTYGVLNGNGDGTFAAGSPVVWVGGNAAYRPRIDVLDLNEDGKLDVLWSGSGRDAVTVMLGNGDGTFSMIPAAAPLAGATLVALADVNADGRPDLVETRYADRSVAVLPGNGDGTFGAARIAVPASGVFFDSFADVNADGVPDLVGNDSRGNGVVGVVTGNGDGTFGVLATFDTGVPMSFATAFDVNADGATDLLIADASGQWGVSLGNGNGSFGPRRFFSDLGSVSSLVPMDANADGAMDFLYTWNGVYPPAAGVFLGNAGREFVGEPYVVRHPRASLTSLDRTDDSGVVSGVGGVSYTATFSAPVTGVDAGDFRVTTGGSVSADPLVVVTRVSTSVYRVTVTGIHGSGTVSLTFADNGSVRDAAAGYPLATRANDVTFAPTRTLFADVTRGGFAVADVDGDHRPDLVESTSTSGGIGVMPGNGDGTFGAARSIFAGGRVLAAADFNGDGKVDVVGATTDGSALFTLFGNGERTFRVPVDAHVSIGPYDTASVNDYNLDGRPDLVVTGTSLYVSLLKGNGDGTFAYILTPSRPGALGDVTGDGRPDLIVSDSSSTLAVLAQKPDGTFQPLRHLSIPYYVESLAALDFNGDGNVDVLAFASSKTFLLPGSGDGNFGAAVEVSLGSSTLVSDLTGDGIPDLAAPAGDYLILSRGVGGGSFVPMGEIPRAAYPSGIVPTDLNGDGRSDLVMVMDYFWSIGVAMNTALGGLTGQAYQIRQTLPSVVSIAPGRATPSPSIVDFTVTFSEAVTGVDASDFRTAPGGSATVAGSIVVTPLTASTYDVTVYGVSGTGTLGLNLVDDGSIRNAIANPLAQPRAGNVFGPRQEVSGFDGDIFYGSDIVAVDLNGDHRRDLVARGGRNELAITRADGTLAAVNLPGTDYGGIVVGDVNNDGVADLVGYSDVSTGMIGTLLGNGDGTFSAPIPYPSPARNHLVLADFNGDGRLDLAGIQDYSPNILVVLTGNGDGNFGAGRTFDAGTTAFSLAAADVDDDGRSDLLVGGGVVNFSGSGVLRVLAGRADGGLDLRPAVITGLMPQKLILTDVNADGRVDVVASDYFQGGVLVGNGDGAFAAPRTWAEAGHTKVIDAVDVTGDGNVDLVIAADFRSHVLSLLVGNGDGSFRPPQSCAAGPVEWESLNSADMNGDARPDLILAGQWAGGATILFGRDGGFEGAVVTVGNVVDSNVVTGSGGVDHITLVRDVDGAHVDWTSDGGSGRMLISDAAGILIKGNGSNDVITLNYANGNPLPGTLRLNGTFTIGGFQGTDPLAGRTLDIGGSTVYVSYAGDAPDPLTMIRAYLVNGYAGGAWTGAAAPSGAGVITSSAARDNPNHNTAIGYADSINYPVRNPVPDSILLKYTLMGDADLDGTVGLNDYTLVVRNFGRGNIWTDGALTYGGAVGLNDYTAVVRNFGQTAPMTSPAALPTVVSATAATNASVPSGSTKSAGVSPETTDPKKTVKKGHHGSGAAKERRR